MAISSVGERTRSRAEGDHQPEVDGERNRLLTGLPADESALLDDMLEPYEVRSRELMTEARDEITHVHFPQTSVISLVTVLNDGGVEALTVGSDGMSGVPIINGIGTTFCRIVGQIPGMSKRTPAHSFAAALPRLPELKRRTHLYSQLANEITSQSAACNRVHVTEERCARWLLMSQDRVGRDEFELTQGFLSQMLGVRRPAVTVAIGILERAGLISHRRGTIGILNREGLERASCECYDLVKEREKQLFSASTPL